jgi:hypothetical protein
MDRSKAPKLRLALPFIGIGKLQLGHLAAFALRASAIIFDIHMGPPGEFLRFGKTDNNETEVQK